MKRLSYIFAMGLIFSLLLSIVYVHVRATPEVAPVERVIPAPDVVNSLPLIPTDINTINQLFPFNKDMVCRRPENMIPHVGTQNKYHFQRFITSREFHPNAKWKIVEGNDVYKNGNSTLLIPQSFTVPSRSVLYPKNRSTIIIPKD